MNTRRTAFLAGVGCALLVLALVVAIPVTLAATGAFGSVARAWNPSAATINQVMDTATRALNASSASPGAAPAAAQAPTVPLTSSQAPTASSSAASGSLDSIATLYQKVNPGVVNVQVQIDQGFATGQGAGSGFIIDTDGHIVTNNHVVDSASRVTVVFYNGMEAEAQVVGTDPDSDLAVLKVDALPAGAHALTLADSSRVEPGEWVVAIGNPFQLGGSMTIGIVSATGRTIPSGFTPFSIPQAIQTDAAINPGNSGGPLLNLKGEVIGVNAQIESGGIRANAGVGFAIPSNFVQQVAPALIRNGKYEWPWLGISGTDVNLSIMEANNLDSQQGAYIADVDPNGPAAAAGLRGSSHQATADSLQVPAGGDVVVAIDGQPITSFDELVTAVASHHPGDKVDLTVLRKGQQESVTVTLAPRPADRGTSAISPSR
jgi:S1-C subfamily serine protease